MTCRIANVLRVGVVLGVLGPGVTTETHAQPQRRGLPAPEEVILPADPVEVSMHRYEGLPLIEVMINGQGPYRLVVDTGASGVLLRADLSDELDLPSPPGMPAGGVQMQVRTPSGPVAATLAYIDELRIGDVQARGVSTIITELPFGEAVDGVLSMNLFRSGLLTFDYPGGRVVMSRGELPDVNERDVFSYQTPGNSGSHPSIEMIVGDTSTTFMIDTGFRGWFFVPATFAQEMGITAGPVESSMALSVGGAVKRQLTRVAESISLGRYVVNLPVVSILSDAGGASPTAPGTGNVVGTYFLENFVVTFDGTNNRLQLASGPETPMTPPAVRHLGLGLKQIGKEMEVWAIHPVSNARSLGLSEGDRIHAFNGRSAVEMCRSPQWRELLRTADTVTVTYAPGGSGPTREVDMHILELLPAER